MERGQIVENLATSLHLEENLATNPQIMEDKTNLATNPLIMEDKRNPVINLLLGKMEEADLATNLQMVELVANPATNLPTEVDQVQMEANPAINPPIVAMGPNPTTELQATIRSIPVAIGNPLIKTIYKHLQQCKYVISFCVFL